MMARRGPFVLASILAVTAAVSFVMAAGLHPGKWDSDPWSVVALAIGRFAAVTGSAAVTSFALSLFGPSFKSTIGPTLLALLVFTSCGALSVAP